MPRSPCGGATEMPFPALAGTGERQAAVCAETMSLGVATWRDPEDKSCARQTAWTECGGPSHQRSPGMGADWAGSLGAPRQGAGCTERVDRSCWAWPQRPGPGSAVPARLPCRRQLCRGGREERGQRGPELTHVHRARPQTVTRSSWPGLGARRGLCTLFAGGMFCDPPSRALGFTTPGSKSIKYLQGVSWLLHCGVPALDGPWHGRRVAGRAGSVPAPAGITAAAGWAALWGSPWPRPCEAPRAHASAEKQFSGICSPPRGPQAAPLPSCGCGRPEDLCLEGAWAPPSVPSGQDRLLCAPRESWDSVLPRVCCHRCTHTCSVMHSRVHTSCPHTGSHVYTHKSHLSHT